MLHEFIAFQQFSLKRILFNQAARFGVNAKKQLAPLWSAAVGLVLKWLKNKKNKFKTFKTTLSSLTNANLQVVMSGDSGKLKDTVRKTIRVRGPGELKRATTWKIVVGHKRKRRSNSRGKRELVEPLNTSFNVTLPNDAIPGSYEVVIGIS